MSHNSGAAASVRRPVEVIEGGLSKEERQKLLTNDRRRVGYAVAGKAAISERILQTWGSILNAPPDLAELKWADYIRTTELAAKYAGLLDDASKPITVNQLYIDVRGATEEQLLAMLSASQAKRDAIAEQGGPFHDGPAAPMA